MKCICVAYSDTEDSTSLESGACLTFRRPAWADTVKVVMDVEEAEYVPALATGVGLAVYVHRPGSVPGYGTKVTAVPGHSYRAHVTRVR